MTNIDQKFKGKVYFRTGFKISDRYIKRISSIKS